MKPPAVVGECLLLMGWIALVVFATNLVALFGLVLTQGLLGFAVGSTLMTLCYAAAGAPTMGGSYATAARNFGAAVGPVRRSVARHDAR